MFRALLSLEGPPIEADLLVQLYFLFVTSHMAGHIGRIMRLRRLDAYLLHIHHNFPPLLLFPP